ncbi:cytochrome b/b6 domain-containing protein [Ramlibacter sp. PS3R-8]|uniref:cytochrome b/b6 domain-containing protein n=1 Tax=Ramlibacter sp. PS3R-8 TaxID=3133437 RepID=UPI0030B3B473
MNTPSASPAERRPLTLVWDAPVRVFHWMAVLCFAVAWLSAESERWQLVHITAGYTLAGLVVFRILWGLVGTRHARFSDFVRGPRAVASYLRSLRGGQPQHHAGHNPAGAVAILGLLALALLAPLTGWASYQELAGHWMGELHEGIATAMLALVVVHVAAVVASSLLHGENLVGAMIHGRKAVSPRDGIRKAWRWLATLMLLAVLAFWWTQWQGAPGVPRDAPSVQSRHDED